jgi:hypothetical protein
MAMIEGEQVSMPANHTFQGTGDFAVGGTQGLFSALEARGLVWTGTDFLLTLVVLRIKFLLTHTLV